VKRLFRPIPRPLTDNARRAEFNDLMRQTYGGREPVFDLAAAEATFPDGARELHLLHGRQIEALAHSYTDDGGHLNAIGRVQVARSLAATLGSLVAGA
jgi:hypothetical protein